GTVIGIDPAAVLFNDLLHDGQPQTGPLWLARDIGVKDPPEQLTLEPRTIVTHGYHGVRSIATEFEPARDLERRRGNALQGLQRVRHEIVENLPNPPPVRLDPLNVLVEVQPNGGTRILRTVQVGDLGHQLVQAEVGDLHFRGTRVLAESI